MEYAIQTFGCKVNQYESAVISEGMIKKGFTKADNPKLAEIVIINSCSVTEQSDKKACQLIRKLKNNNLDCIIALCGCFPQAQSRSRPHIIVANHRFFIAIPPFALSFCFQYIQRGYALSIGAG